MYFLFRILHLISMTLRMKILIFIDYRHFYSLRIHPVNITKKVGKISQFKNIKVLSKLVTFPPLC